jgi:hypothetical protein
MQALGGLTRQLKGMSGMIEPLQSSLGVHTLTRNHLLVKASSLPAPLYAVFHQFADYKHTRGDVIKTVLTIVISELEKSK